MEFNQIKGYQHNIELSDNTFLRIATCCQWSIDINFRNINVRYLSHFICYRCRGVRFVMVYDPLESVYSIVERTYIRLQTGDILIRCLEEKSSEPMNDMVEGLILAGPKSLDAMHEILSEVIKRKSELKDDINQIINDLNAVMLSYGVKIGRVKDTNALLGIKPAGFLNLIQQQNIKDDETQMACLQVFQDSRDLILNLHNHLEVLEEIEYYLRDWIWGMVYKQIRTGQNPAQTNNLEKIL